MNGKGAKGSNGVAAHKRRNERNTLPAPYEQRLQKIEDERSEIHRSIDRVVKKLAETVDDSNDFAIPVNVDDEEDSLVVRMHEAMPAVRR